MKMLKLKSRDEYISDKKIYMLLKFGSLTIIDIQLKIWCPPELCSSMINMILSKTLKPVCLSSNILFSSSSKWVVRKPHDIITKDG